MLADMKRDDWLAALGLAAAEVPAALILRGTRQLKEHAARHRGLLAGARELVSANGIFEDIVIGLHRGTRLAIACIYGPSMASEVAHVFSLLGVSRIILTGCCGALDARIAPGDIVVPAAAFPGDGASRYYGADGSTAMAADAALHEAAVAAVKASGWNACSGAIYTTAALCAESAADVQAWAAEGYMAVDMETATVYAVARYFAVPAVAVLFAFDCLAAGESIVLTDAEKSGRRSQGEEIMTQIALRLAADQNAERPQQ